MPQHINILPRSIPSEVPILGLKQSASIPPGVAAGQAFKPLIGKALDDLVKALKSDEERNLWRAILGSDGKAPAIPEAAAPGINASGARSGPPASATGATNVGADDIAGMSNKALQDLYQADLRRY